MNAVRQYLADGSTTNLDPTTWTADLATPPPRLHLSKTPPPVNTAAGVSITPVGCVEFVAGWADAASVPPLVKTGLKLLAAYWYQHREAYEDGTLTEVPMGWTRLVARYWTGVTGDWGQ